MAARFWVGGTGTWDAASTAFWAATSGGAGGQTVPGTGDTATFDANSGGGTVTVDSPNGAGVVTVQQIIMGAFTGTLDFATNNNNVTLSVSFVLSGTGTRTLNMGDGTWTFTATGGVNVWDATTTTNLTFNANSSSIALSATATANRGFVGGGLTYNNLTVSNAAANSRVISFSSAATFNNLTFTNVRYVGITTGVTLTVSGALSYDGTSTSVGALITTTGSTATISVANANTLNWLNILGITKAGAGSITANNSFDGGNNSGVTINAPSSGVKKHGFVGLGI